MFYWPDLTNLKPIHKDLSLKQVSGKIYASLAAKVMTVSDINQIKEADARQLYTKIVVKG